MASRAFIFGDLSSNLTVLFMSLQTAPITCWASERRGGSTFDFGYKLGDRLVHSLFWFCCYVVFAVSYRNPSLMQAEELVPVRENKEGDANFISSSLPLYRTVILNDCILLYLSRIRNTTTSTRTSARISWRTIWKVSCSLPISFLAALHLSRCLLRRGH